MIDVFTDGATIGKNGTFGTVSEVGLGIYIPDLKIERAVKAKGLSNNEAEFKALVYAMELAILHGAKKVRFNMDSQIVLNRCHGKRPTKQKFRNERMDAFQDRVLELKKDFELCLFRWIPREENTKADELSNIAKTQKLKWV